MPRSAIAIHTTRVGQKGRPVARQINATTHVAAALAVANATMDINRSIIFSSSFLVDQEGCTMCSTTYSQTLETDFVNAAHPIVFRIFLPPGLEDGSDRNTAQPVDAQSR